MEPALESIVSADEELRARLERVSAEARARLEAAEAEIQRRDDQRRSQYEREVQTRVASILAASGGEQQERSARRAKAVAERLSAARASLPAASDAFARLLREGPST